jgi:hypothetical protein
MQKHIPLLIIVIISFSCAIQENKNVNDIFKPDFTITYKDIENEGFKFPKDVDVPMFTKTIGDTIFAFQFDDTPTDESKPVYMSMQFYLDSLSIDPYYFHGKDCFTFCETKSKQGISLYLKNFKTNFFYKASIEKDGTDSTKIKIHISFDYPQINIK